MRIEKEHKFLIFYLDDGKIVKYDLSTGETIGKLGKPVKNLNTQLAGHNVYTVIDSFENESYKKFLRFVLRHFINNCRDRNARYDHEVNRVKNVGSFLSKLKNYSMFEQYFAAGITNPDPELSIPMSKIPKNLLKLCRVHELFLHDNLVNIYIKHEKYFENLIRTKCASITKEQKFKLLDAEKHTSNSYYYRNRLSDNFFELVNKYKYTPMNLLVYIDHLITYEALELDFVLQELVDYNNMVSRISERYDKYPRNFLTTQKIATRNYRRLREHFDEQKFENTVDETFDWKYEDYVILCPRKVQDIKDEAVMQNNCVASYVQSVIDGKCHILFMRKKDEKNKSLVTMEVQENKVVQALGKFNRTLTKEEKEVTQKYNNYLLKRNKKVEEISRELMEMVIAC